MNTHSNTASEHEQRVPWQGLGYRLQPDYSVDEILKVAQLDWQVHKLPLFAFDGEQQIKSTRKMLVREKDSKELDIVSNDWHPVQNSKAISFFHELAKNCDLELYAAGSLQYGRRVWCLARIKENVSITKGDSIKPFLLFSNPHIYGKAIEVMLISIRDVSNTTFGQPLLRKSSSSVTISHKTPFSEKRKEAQVMLSLAREKFTDFGQQAQRLARSKCTSDDLCTYFATVFPKQSRNHRQKFEGRNDFEATASLNAKQAMQVLTTQPGAELSVGTYWQAFNAVVYLIDYQVGHSPDTRLSSSWFGTNKSKKLKALQIALQMAET